MGRAAPSLMTSEVSDPRRAKAVCLGEASVPCRDGFRVSGGVCKFSLQ